MKTGLFDHALLAEALCLSEIGNSRNVKDNQLYHSLWTRPGHDKTWVQKKNRTIEDRGFFQCRDVRTFFRQLTCIIHGFWRTLKDDDDDYRIIFPDDLNCIVDEKGCEISTYMRLYFPNLHETIMRNRKM